MNTYCRDENETIWKLSEGGYRELLSITPPEIFEDAYKNHKSFVMIDEIDVESVRSILSSAKESADIKILQPASIDWYFKFGLLSKEIYTKFIDLLWDKNKYIKCDDEENVSK